jgi:O-antigen ligase
VVAIEAAVALLQVYAWDSGLGYLRQQTGTSGGVRTAGLGTMGHPYLLSFYLTVGSAILLASFKDFSHRWIVAVTVALATFAAASTYGRTGAVAIILVGGTYLVGALANRSRLRAIKSSLVLGPFALGVVANSEPWLIAARQTTSGGSLDRATSGRIELIDASLDMIARRPFFGYGLRQWMTGLADVRDAPLTITRVHNVPLLAGAEMGVAALITLLTLYAVLFYRSIRTSIGAVAIFLSALPALMLDKMTLDFATMMVIAVLWVASLDYHWRQKQAERVTTAVAPEPT